MNTRLLTLGCLAGGCLLAGPSSVTADEIPACQLGREWREALGFGGAQASAMGVNAEMLQIIESAVETYCAQNRNTVEPLLATIRMVRASRARAYELGTASSQDDQALIDAIAELANACGAAIASMREYLTTGQKTMFDRIAANRLLDPALAILELTSQQRSDLRAAQRTRDLTLRHHKDRKDLVACRSAMDAFNTTVGSTLSGNQQTEYQTSKTSSSAHFGSNLTVEQQACS